MILSLPLPHWKTVALTARALMMLQAGKVEIEDSGRLEVSKVESCALNISPNGIIWRPHKLGNVCLYECRCLFKLTSYAVMIVPIGINFIFMARMITFATPLGTWATGWLCLRSRCMINGRFYHVRQFVPHFYESSN